MYEWECSECTKVTTVLHSFDDYRRPPEKCDFCENKDPEKFRKLIGSTNFVLNGRGWARDGYS